MKIRYYFVFMLLIIVAFAVMGFTATLSLRAYGISVNPGMKYIEYSDIEKGLNPDQDADNGFVVNPYQANNQEQNQSVIIGASVLFLLREVKTFTMFAVILAVLALIAYIIIAYIVLNSIAAPIIKAGGRLKNEESSPLPL